MEAYTIIIAVTINAEGLPYSTINSRVAKMFSDDNWKLAQLPSKLAQDIRIFTSNSQAIGDLLNKMRLGELST